MGPNIVKERVVCCCTVWFTGEYYSFEQNHQVYFQGNLMLYQDMFDDFLAKDPQKWENHKMNKNLDSSFQKILLGNAVRYVSSTIVHTTVLYIFAKVEKKGRLYYATLLNLKQTNFCL